MIKKVLKQARESRRKEAVATERERERLKLAGLSLISS
jgi:hypothetical protein